jgi:hypothetical protein
MFAVFVVGFGCGCVLRCLWMVRKSSGLVQVQAQEFAQEFAQEYTGTCTGLDVVSIEILRLFETLRCDFFV